MDRYKLSEKKKKKMYNRALGNFAPWGKDLIQKAKEG